MRMTKQEFLISCELPAPTLELYLEQQWIIPEQTSTGVTFCEMDIARVHLIQDLKVNIGANDEGIDIILHLIDQVHGLRYALAQVQKKP
ncbi:chaperone modulator CbpM [Bordetella genomosp. 4]|nr:chaperone modulator CbpM [Bordetella genomosp. 4]